VVSFFIAVKCTFHSYAPFRYPSERLSRTEALKGMTLDAAYASFSEDTLGSLSIGKKADFVVLDRDIMTVPMEQILGAKVTSTVIDGETVYGNLY
jgi:predicted amidohydrolase YtcJ